MKPIEILFQYRDMVQQNFEKTGSWPKAYEVTKSDFPVFSRMSFSTFKMYGSIMAELNRLNIEKLNKKVKHKLNNPVKQKTVKQDFKVSGWSIQKSGGYYRAFKKIDGKLRGVYLGKSLENAEQKIMEKMKI